MPAAPFQPPGTPAAISYYDTEPLRRTLEQLVDFELLNSGAVRLSVGAVNVKSGNFVYFDSRQRRIDARHIMASGALPPGFPPIEIDGEFYWDGGLVSNTPLQYVLDQPGHRPRLVFQVDLFAARGEMPANLAEASEREKDIRYSSRTRLTTTYELRRQATLQAARRLVAKLPPALRDDPDAQALAALPLEAAVAVVHLIYRSKHYESQSKDYEFSRASMLEHWAAGMTDTQTTLEDPRWLERERHDQGVHVFDMTSPSSARHQDHHPQHFTEDSSHEQQVAGQDRIRHRRRQRHRHGHRRHLCARRRQGRDRRPEHGGRPGRGREAEGPGPDRDGGRRRRDRRRPGQRRRRRGGQGLGRGRHPGQQRRHPDRPSARGVLRTPSGRR